LQEEWKTIEDFPDYEVSSQGRVKSFKRYKEGKILKPGKDRKGYLVVNLYKNRKRYHKRIHRLVLEAFKPIENSNKFECNHKDGNKENNYIENLEWMTCSENHKHAHRIGLKNNKDKNNPFYGKHHSEEWKKEHSERMKGENHPQSILTEKDVIEIIKLCNEGNLTQKEIGELFGVSRDIISDIKTGKSWKHIKYKED